MKREEHLEYCKICLNRKVDFHKGMICSLTNEIANFDPTCKDFKEDPIELEKRTKQKVQTEFNNASTINNGTQWFLWIFGLSVLNSVILYTGGGISFIFGLGITQIFEGFLIGYSGQYTLNGLIISILISSIFVLIWYSSRNLNKNAFILGMIIYGIDGLLLLIFQDWLSFGFHIYALVMIFKAYQNVDQMKELLSKQQDSQ